MILWGTTLSILYWPKLIDFYKINSKKSLRNALLLKFLTLELFNEEISQNFEE